MLVGHCYCEAMQLLRYGWHVTARTSYGWLVVDLVNVGILKEEEMSGHWHWHVGKHVGFNG